MGELSGYPLAWCVQLQIDTRRIAPVPCCNGVVPTSDWCVMPMWHRVTPRYGFFAYHQHCVPSPTCDTGTGCMNSLPPSVFNCSTVCHLPSLVSVAMPELFMVSPWHGKSVVEQCGCVQVDVPILPESQCTIANRCVHSFRRIFKL